MATKKKVKKVKEVKEPSKPVLEGWTLDYAKRLKWNRKTQFIVFEFVRRALELGQSDKDLEYVREIVSDLERPESLETIK